MKNCLLALAVFSWMAGVRERVLLQQYPKQLACDRIWSKDSSIVMLEQRGREAVVKNLTISVLEGFSLRPLSVENLLTIWSVQWHSGWRLL